MYLCGHNHNLQHLRHKEGQDIDYVVSGAGGALLSWYVSDNEEILNEMGVESLHFSYSYGFVGFTISEEEMYWEFVKHNGEVLYSHTRPKKDKRRRPRM